MNENTLYTIKDVAERTGISQHTLRFYDKEGLLPFIKKSAGGTRLFSDEDFESLYTITCLKKSGMSIKQIQAFMELYARGPETLKQRQEMFEAQREKVLAQMTELQEMLEVIDYKCWYFSEAQRLDDPDFYKKLSPEEQPPQMKEFLRKVDGFWHSHA
ncbi:MAG: MerR family transcriptional regulator [Firmicutes bacterium]|nr:MerR family transcriptional regulator [Bacillota bacterium]